MNNAVVMQAKPSISIPPSLSIHQIACQNQFIFFICRYRMMLKLLLAALDAPFFSMVSTDSSLNRPYRRYYHHTTGSPGDYFSPYFFSLYLRCRSPIPSRSDARVCTLPASLRAARINDFSKASTFSVNVPSIS
jgi:hypothetical protein